MTNERINDNKRRSEKEGKNETVRMKKSRKDEWKGIKRGSDEWKWKDERKWKWWMKMVMMNENKGWIKW